MVAKLKKVKLEARGETQKIRIKLATIRNGFNPNLLDHQSWQLP